MILDDKKVVVIGGSSGIGLGIARASVDEGADTVIASRSSQKLEAARRQLGDNVQTVTVDLADESSIIALMAEIGAFDHLVITGGRTTNGAFLELASDIAREDFDINFWGKYNATKYAAPHIRQGGSITFISGVYGRKPSPNAVVTAASVSATDSLGRALAVALSPIRVNTIAPGLVDTPMVMPAASEEEREDFFKSVGQNWPAKTVGIPENFGQVAVLCMTNPFISGSTIYVDGGYTIV